MSYEVPCDVSVRIGVCDDEGKCCVVFEFKPGSEPWRCTEVHFKANEAEYWAAALLSAAHELRHIEGKTKG